eukprot:GHVU01003816.1.p1 GENE.GHVU01003816.1~~GHVU01003816.1.p1  ORF type:complete len:122 (+),score=11.06 GHVU01003816.1:1572-1937(+)
MMRLRLRTAEKYFCSVTDTGDYQRRVKRLVDGPLVAAVVLRTSCCQVVADIVGEVRTSEEKDDNPDNSEKPRVTSLVSQLGDAECALISKSSTEAFSQVQLLFPELLVNFYPSSEEVKVNH